MRTPAKGRGRHGARKVAGPATALARARLAAGLTLEQLGARAGLHPVTVAEIEAGRVTPAAETARRLAEALAVPLDRLWPGAGRGEIPREAAAAIAAGKHPLLALAALRGLDQRRLAEAAGRSPQAVSKLVRGERRPAIDTLVALARALGVTAAALARVYPALP